ncbi:MAG: hypothetical protein LH615_00250 [Ferruginibacter sp.]|nr:hypothetical protein [Ferruginibacter sp.]
MNNIFTQQPHPTSAYRIIFTILLVEILIYFFCNIHIAALVNNTFIGFEQDPLLWLIYFTGLPQLILNNIYVSSFIDISILLLLLALILKPLNRWIAITLFILLFIFYAVFTAHLGHRNYQSGYLFILLPFFFINVKRKQIVFEFTRYFLLFFYVSAAFFKLKSGSLFSIDHFSQALVNQFTPYFLERSNSIRIDFNLYLITHHKVASVFYVGATILEFAAIIGFFTKRFDNYLAVIFLLFHFANWFIMDIAPIGQIAFICTLFFTKKFAWKNTNLQP